MENQNGVKQKRRLNPQTLRLQTRVVEWTKSGRRHWDIYRYLQDPYLLHDAIKLVIHNQGSSGLDGETIKSIVGKEWKLAVELSALLKEGAYKPGVVKRVYIPKSDGNKRPLGIPNIRDRVVQRALVLILEPIYEHKFLESSYGFRPSKRAVDCVAKVADEVYSHRHVLEADIAKFFDQVNHNLLLKLITKEIVDPRITKLISKILKTGSQELRKSWEPSIKGTPQGGPLSPLLANIYLHYVLDGKFKEIYGQNKRVKLFRYADDFVIVATRKEELEVARSLLNIWMAEASLNLKEEKTRVIDMTNESRGYESKFDFLGFKIHLRSFKDNNRRFWVARQPSEKSRKNLKASIRAKLMAHMKMSEVRQKLEQIWRGWCNYFRYSNANRIFYKEIRNAERLVYRFLRRKFRRQRCPVPWRKLHKLARGILSTLKPVRVIPNHLNHQRQMLF